MTAASNPFCSAPEIAENSRTAPLDAVIVGGGTAGIAAARTLAEHGRRVVILEAGPLALLTHATEVTALPPGASYHEAGGLIMDTDPGSSVTDAFGRFHQLPNLVAVNASTWPKLGAANPHLTIAAFSRCQSSQLADDLQKG